METKYFQLWWTPTMGPTPTPHPHPHHPSLGPLLVCLGVCCGLHGVVFGITWEGARAPQEGWVKGSEEGW